MADSCAERIYSVLAAHPGGLPTPRIYELSGEHIEPRQRALTKYGGALSRYEYRGWVRRVGRTPGGRRLGPSVIWQLAPGTRREIFAGRTASRKQGAAGRREREVEQARVALEEARDAGHWPSTPYELQLMVCAALHVAGCTNAEIARLFGVTGQAISKRLLTHPDVKMWNAVFSLAAFEALRQRQVTN